MSHSQNSVESKPVKKPASVVGWGTTSEIKWLTTLRKRNPKAFENYRKTIRFRRRWGAIDRNLVAAFLGIAVDPHWMKRA